MPRHVRLGLALFFLYLAFYGGFVLLAALSPATMALRPWAGVNLAIWYGLALIVAALVLALIYGWVCRGATTEPSARSEGPLASSPAPTAENQR